MDKFVMVEREFLDKIIQYAEFDLLVDDDIPVMGGGVPTIERLIDSGKVKELPTSAQFAGEMEKDLRLLDALAIKYCPQVYLNTVIKAGVDELLSDIAAAKEVTE